MADDMFSEIDALEKQLENEPDSETVWRKLLVAFLAEELFGHPRRVERVVEFVRRFPRHWIARTPYVAVDPDASSAGFQRVQDQWLQHRREYPADTQIARGLALFLAESSPERGLDVLREAATTAPDDAELWTEMGRICLDPAQRPEFLQRARSLGSTQPNLLAWIGRAAVDAGELEVAARAGSELLTLVEQARSAHGELIDGMKSESDLWATVKARFNDDASAHVVFADIRDNANRKHWGHTILGLVALRQNGIEKALDHLRQSGEVVREPRLSSYGPSFRLARELAAQGKWKAVADYRRACLRFWNPDLLASWIADIERCRLPDFPDQ